MSEGGVFFQRYNGNGVDLNRDWPDIGFSFRPYSGLSEPESRALATFFDDVKATTGDEFDAGDDLHGQPTADALSYTLLPHGRHDFAKDQRIRDTAIAIHRASEKALLWSPIIRPNDSEPGSGPPCVPGPLGSVCAQILGQTWGTVYDTINYTTTGALGDYFDSSIGLGADGIDNEMSFSHLDKNIVFDPHTEQLHVDGNKALIFAHLARLASPVTRVIDVPGRQGYVPNDRLRRQAAEFQPGAPPGTSPQTDIANQAGTPAADEPGSIEFPFEVQRSSTVFNGGMRVDITKESLQGVGNPTADAAGAVQGLRRAPRRPGERRLGDRQRGLQPVAGLPPGRADGRRQPAAVGHPERPEGGMAGDPRRAGRGADERGLHLRPRHHRRAPPAATTRRAWPPTTWPTRTSSRT